MVSKRPREKYSRNSNENATCKYCLKIDITHLTHLDEQGHEKGICDLSVF